MVCSAGRHSASGSVLWSATMPSGLEIENTVTPTPHPLDLPSSAVSSFSTRRAKLDFAKNLCTEIGKRYLSL